jgi:antitoxin HicB
MYYEIELAPDDNGTVLVRAPSFPEVITYGDNEVDADMHARFAIEEAIAARIAHGDDIPSPAEQAGDGHWVYLPALSALKAALYMQLRLRGLTRAELARRLNWHREQVDRLFRLDHASRLDQIEDAFRAVGEPLNLNVPFPKAA